MQRYRDVVLNGRGEPVPNVSVLVLTYPAGALADLFADDAGTVLANPVPSDPNGAFSFKAANGHYSLVISGAGVTAQTINDVVLNDAADTLAQLAANGGSNLVAFTQDGAGAVPTTVQDALRERVSVRRFIDTAIDGATSNQAGIVAAVAYAYANGVELHWPAGTYVSDATIPNFHDVTHGGSGVLTRGGDSWKFSGRTGTNVLYVSPTGSNANDGLTAAAPKQTLQSVFDILPGWADQLMRNGTFKVQLAAGTYNAAAALVGLRSKNRIVIAGPAVGGHPAVPTALIDGTGISNSVGLYLQNSISAYLQDIKLQNWTYGGTPYGLAVDSQSDVTQVNVHYANCGYAGCSYDNISIGRILGGVIDSCPAYGVRVYSQSSVSVGYSNQAAGSTSTTVGSSTIITNCNTAIYGANSCRVHVDYCDLENNATGILMEKNSRAVANYTKFANNTIHVQWQLESAYGESGATNTFSGGKNYVCYSGSDDINYTQNYWDRTAQRTLYGAPAYRNVNAKFEWQLDAASSGASYNSSVKAIFDGNSATNYIGLSGPATSSTGFIWSTVAKSAQAVMAYNFSDDTWRLWVSGAYSYCFKATSLNTVLDNTRSMGESGIRWTTVYAYNLSLKPPASIAPAVNGEMTFELTSDTQLKIKVKGSDGVVRSASLTLA